MNINKVLPAFAVGISYNVEYILEKIKWVSKAARSYYDQGIPLFDIHVRQGIIEATDGARAHFVKIDGGEDEAIYLVNKGEDFLTMELDENKYTRGYPNLENTLCRCEFNDYRDIKISRQYLLEALQMPTDDETIILRIPECDTDPIIVVGDNGVFKAIVMPRGS